MLSPIATTMPKRSVIRPVGDAAETEAEHRERKGQRYCAPRVAPNSLCTTGSTTTIDHMPTLPIEPITTASASLIQA